MITNKYVPAFGNPNAQLMILGESPSFKEVEQGKPFVGPSGMELDSILKAVGISRSSLWVSNVCKYFVPPSPKEKKIPFAVRAEQAGINLEEQLSDLQNEINTIKPNCILALGGTALWATTGKTSITEYRGSILFGMGHKVVPTFHPAHLLHKAAGAEMKGYWNKQIMILDFKRAVEESLSPNVDLPRRQLSICGSSAQLLSFVERYKNHTRPSIDIEAGGTCIPVCIGIAFTPNEGLTVPLWNTDPMFYSISNQEMAQMWLILSKLLSSSDIVGQNFKYDQDKIRRLGFTIRSLASDTMLKAFVINPELPKALEFNQSIYTREPFYKGKEMYESDFKNLLIGCARDACVTKEIDLAMDADIDELQLRDFYENFVLKLHDLYLGIENEGFNINPDQRDFLIGKYIRWSEQLSHELFTLTNAYINVNSHKQVYTLLFEVLKLPRRAGTGEEEITALLNNQSSRLDDRKRRILEIILEKRRVDKTIGTYLMALPDYDGKMKTTYYLCLETGRTATGQLEPPIRPWHDKTTGEVTKKKTNRKALGMAFQTITKHGDIGHDVRSQLVPEPGYTLINVDSAQAEARVVFLLANDEQALRDIDEHDYHALTASWFFGGCEDDYSKKKLGYESPIRFAGKTLRHAGHLGAGKRRASIELNTQARKYKIPIQIDEGTAERALKIFHQKQPKIQQVFHNGIIECLAKDRRYLTAPLPYGINAKTGGKRQFFERWGDELFREAFAYIPQRAVSDNTKAAALRIRQSHPWIKIILEAHDALLCSAPTQFVQEAAGILRQEMERPIDFSTCSLPRRSLVIPADVEIGDNYMELKKYKFPKEDVVIIPQPILTPTERFRV
jgi:uracil-DNA glycosylase family 4